MTETSTKHAMPHAKRPFFAHAMRVLAVPIILGWVLFTVVVNTSPPHWKWSGRRIRRRWPPKMRRP